MRSKGESDLPTVAQGESDLPTAKLRSKGALALARQADAKRQKEAIPPAFHAGRGRPAYGRAGRGRLDADEAGAVPAGWT